MARRKKTRPPELPPGAPGRPEKDRYREQYGVIVICRDQAHQAEVYRDLKQGGHDVRVVVT